MLQWRSWQKKPPTGWARSTSAMVLTPDSWQMLTLIDPCTVFFFPITHNSSLIMRKWSNWFYTSKLVKVIKKRNKQTSKQNNNKESLRNCQSQEKLKETWQLSLTWYLHGIPEEAMEPHSSHLAWKIPRTEGPGGLQSLGSLGVGHDGVTSLSLFTFMHWRRKWPPTPVFLPGESQGRGSLVGCRLWGHTGSDTTEAT